MINNVFAGEKEPGYAPIPPDILNDLKANLDRIIKKNPSENILVYLSVSEGGFAYQWSGYKKDITDKNHSRTYKKCLKNAKKYKTV